MDAGAGLATADAFGMTVAITSVDVATIAGYLLACGGIGVDSLPCVYEGGLQ